MMKPISVKNTEPVFPFDLRLERGGEAGLIETLHRRLRAAILDGRLAPGTALPATRRAASALSVGRNTVVAAYDLLIAEGYAVSRAGARTTVAETVARRSSASRMAPRRIDALQSPWRHASSPTAVPAPPARSFRLGVPESLHFPHALWRRLAARAWRDAARQPFDYQPPEGLPDLREGIAHHVAFARAVACAADDVLVTMGAQQAFDLLARALVAPGRTKVAVEEPGYPPSREAFLAAGAILAPVPVDDEGLNVERLPEDTRIVVVTPSHQSPTGAALSLRRRTALLAFARRRDAIVIEDDYDGEFRFGARPLDALQTLDRDGRVFYVGTFSKSLFPAIRKGFVVAPPWARDALRAIQRTAIGHADAPMQATLAAFLREGHLARHVRGMRPIYAGRRDALLEAFDGPLAPWFQAIPSEAGLHLAARIRDPAQVERIVAAVRRYAPGAQSTAEYAITRGITTPAIAFGYGGIDANDIRRATDRLRAALARGRAG